jgi:hypothetical protein
MLKDRLKEIENQKSKLAALQQALLEDLHTVLGYAKRSALIQELQGVGRSKPARKATKKATGKAPRKAAKKTRKAAKKTAPKKAAKKAAPKVGKRRKRTTITPELRNDIIAAVKGGATGSAVAKQFGVSVPTVQNIKKAAGLTKSK